MDESVCGLKNDKSLLSKLRGLVTNIRWSPTDANRLFNALLNRFESNTTNDRSQFLSWMLKMLHSIEIHYITPSWTCQKTGKTLIELVQDKSVKDEKLRDCLAADKPKTLEEILEEIRQQKLKQIDEKLLDELRDIVSSVDEALQGRNAGSRQSGLKKDLLRLCQAAEKTHFRPRLTQIVSLCLLVLSKTGQLIQVSTGEGKSCIVAMFAAFRAMKGEHVDVMSSSSVLAQRDLNEWRDFFKALQISADCNIHKLEGELKKCYQSRVVYGTAHSFAGNWLMQHFQRVDILGERRIQCVIVDEVDSLMLDKGDDVVYLGGDMPALQHITPLLAFIWATANQYSKLGTESTLGRKRPFHQVVLENIKGKDISGFTILQMAEDAGILGKGSVQALRRNMSLLTEKTANVTVNQLLRFFKTVEKRFPSCQFSLHWINNDGAIVKQNKEPVGKNGGKQSASLLLTAGGFCQYMYPDEESVHRAAEEEVKRALRFTPCQLNDDENFYIPGFLSDLVDSNLKVWIENAFSAQTMTKNHEYVTENHGVVPVDYSCTGVVQNFMTLTDGLQQFLEMKHESKLSDMAAITNYMSSVSLLQKYGDQIYGITGTLGQQAETDTLENIYRGITTCRIPTFKRRKLFEVEGICVKDEKEWIEKICNVVRAQINPTVYRGGRAVLVICETIKRAEVVHDLLADKVPNIKLYINNNMDNTAIFASELEAGDVIIATNLAGRGTDLTVSDCVKEAGGLFVVQTFLPKNARVEAQAFGRTARQGSPGSAQLIVCSNHLPELHQSCLENITDVSSPLFPIIILLEVLLERLSNILSENPKSRIQTAKMIRDKVVDQQLARYLERDIPRIKKKEEVFNLYLEVLNDVYRRSNNKPKESDLSALNEFWGMWLLTNFKTSDSVTELKSKLSRDLDRARQKLRCGESPLSNLHHYTVFGNELREEGHLAESIRMYTKAIQEDRCWAAFAYYNRAFASLSLENRRQDPGCINRALEDLQQALRSVELYSEQTKATLRYLTQQNDVGIDSLTRLEKHIITRNNLLVCFKLNINKAMENVNRARSVGGHVKVDKSPLVSLVPLIYLLPLVIRSKELMTVSRSRDPLQILQLSSHDCFDIFTELEHLKSLGLTQVFTADVMAPQVGFLKRFFLRLTED